MLSLPKDFKNFLNIFWIFSYNWFLLSHNPEIDNSHWLREDVQWIMDKVVREKLIA